MRYYLEVGSIISASYNPLEDNGIKFFGKDGQKLTDEQEKAIEDYMLDTDIENSLPSYKSNGRSKNYGYGKRYCKSTVFCHQRM